MSRPRKVCVVDHAQTTTKKTGKLTIGLPCCGEIHGVNYCTSLFVSCRRPCHGEVHGVDYRTSLFVLCHGLCCSTGH